MIVEVSQNQADAVGPQSWTRGSAAICSTGMDTGTSSACLLGPENVDAEKNENY
jgi:hypothetical protein